MSAEPDGPVLYAQLREKAIGGAQDFLVEMLAEALGGADRRMARHYHEVLDRVYAQGVQDGYHEGLAAARAAAEVPHAR